MRLDAGKQNGSGHNERRVTRCNQRNNNRDRDLGTGAGIVELRILNSQRSSYLLYQFPWHLTDKGDSATRR